jgi:uncharacterized protein
MMATRVLHWVDIDALPSHSAHAFDFAVAPLADGAWLTVPVNVIVGARHRPRLLAVAGVHGDEPEGILALLDFWAARRPDELRGTVVLIPVANPPAFAAHRRRNPVDEMDLNRAFPGKLDGTVSERLAYRLFHEIVIGSDFVFSMHGWHSSGNVVPYAEYPSGTNNVCARSLEGAQAAGFHRLREGSWPAGLLVGAANAAGIPGFEAEIGGYGVSFSENRAAYVDHLQSLLLHMGILDGRPRPNPAPEFYARGLIAAPAGGVLRLAVDLGASVTAGALLATITDLHGELVAEIRAPEAGLVAGIRQAASVSPGDNLFALYPRIPAPFR